MTHKDLQKRLWNVLAPHGFKKISNGGVLEYEDLRQHVVLSRIPPRGKPCVSLSRFVVNVYDPELFQMRFGNSYGDNKDEWAVGQIHFEPATVWDKEDWLIVLQQDSNLDEIESRFHDLVEIHIVPYLQGVRTREQLLRRLRNHEYPQYDSLQLDYWADIWDHKVDPHRESFKEYADRILGPMPVRPLPIVPGFTQEFPKKK